MNHWRKNAPCPCGSGEKYKRCCLREGRRWYEDHKGRPIPEGLAKTYPQNPKIRSALIEHLDEEGKLATLHEVAEWHELIAGKCIAELSPKGRLSAMHEMGMPPELLLFLERTGHLPQHGVWSHWGVTGCWTVHPRSCGPYRKMVREGVAAVQLAYPFLPESDPGADVTFVEATAIVCVGHGYEPSWVEEIEVYEEMPVNMMEESTEHL